MLVSPQAREDSIFYSSGLSFTIGLLYFLDSHLCKAIAQFSGLVKSYSECRARKEAEASCRLPHARKNSSVLRVVKLLNKHGKKKPKEARKKYFTLRYKIYICSALLIAFSSLFRTS